MLSGKFRLHDAEDVEALCAAVVRQSGLELSFHEYESLLTYLIETCWELSLKWKPDESRNWGFAAWATTTLRRRVSDWNRSPERGGRTKWQFKDRVYERPQPIISSLDADRNITRSEDGVRSGIVGRPFIEGLVDATPDRSPDLMRVLREGSSSESRQADEVGTGKDRRAA